MPKRLSREGTVAGPIATRRAARPRETRGPTNRAFLRKLETAVGNGDAARTFPSIW